MESLWLLTLQYDRRLEAGRHVSADSPSNVLFLDTQEIARIFLLLLLQFASCCDFRRSSFFASSSCYYISIYIYLLLFLIRVITCTICGLKWPKSRAMTTIRPLQWVFSFPEAYCQNFMLLQACSVFAATAKSYLHNATGITRYAWNMFKTPVAFMCLLYEETVSTAVKTLFCWQFGICRRDRKNYTL